MNNKLTMKDYLKKAATKNTILLLIALAWLAFSGYELYSFLMDAKDKYLSRSYNFPDFLGLNKAQTTVMVAGLFLVLSLMTVIILLVKGIRASKGILIGSGFYWLIVLFGLLALGYFTDMLPRLLKGFNLASYKLDLKSIIFSVLLFISIILALLIIINIIKAGKLPIFSDKYDDDLDFYDDDIEDRRGRYDQDRNQFEAVARDHRDFREETDTVDYSNSNINRNENTIDISEKTLDMDAREVRERLESENNLRQSFYSNNEPINRFQDVTENNSRFQNVDDDVKIAPETNRVNTVSMSKQSDMPTVILPEDKKAMVEENDDFKEYNELINGSNEKINESMAETHQIASPVVEDVKEEKVVEDTVIDSPIVNEIPTSQEEVIDNTEVNKEVEEEKSSIPSANVISEITTSITKKVIAFPGDDTKVIVITRTYENDNLVNEASEIRNKSDL